MDYRRLKENLEARTVEEQRWWIKWYINKFIKVSPEHPHYRTGIEWVHSLPATDAIIVDMLMIAHTIYMDQQRVMTDQVNQEAIALYQERNNLLETISGVDDPMEYLADFQQYLTNITTFTGPGSSRELKQRFRYALNTYNKVLAKIASLDSSNLHHKWARMNKPTYIKQVEIFSASHKLNMMDKDVLLKLMQEYSGKQTQFRILSWIYLTFHGTDTCGVGYIDEYLASLAYIKEAYNELEFSRNVLENAEKTIIEVEPGFVVHTYFMKELFCENLKEFSYPFYLKCAYFMKKINRHAKNVAKIREMAKI
jgi:hypothetical protein